MNKNKASEYFKEQTIQVNGYTVTFKVEDAKLDFDQFRDTWHNTKHIFTYTTEKKTQHSVYLRKSDIL